MTKMKMKAAAKTVSMLNKSRKRSSLARTHDLPMQDDDGHFNPTTIIVLNQCPVVHIHSHEETFFELFYDLIIVVVLMKLSYLKYDFTWAGFFAVVALFANFWSCWSLLNVYVTMVHQEDGLHRFFYGLHVLIASVMCIFTEHPEHSFFSFSTQAYYFTMAGLCSRCLIMIMYGIFYYHDGRMRKDPEMKKHLPEYSRKDVTKQVLLHVCTIFTACLLFAITAYVEAQAPCHRTNHRALAATSYSSYSSSAYGDDDHMECNDHKSITHIVSIILWIVAITIEQGGNFAGAIFGPLPFNGEYGGKRMQAWLMVCFGESVIGLLINPAYFDSVSLQSIMASLFMVFCLVTVYFDIVDADQFLHLFILRKEKWKAFFYCFGHWPFSMSVFFVGVALKIINFIMLAVHDLEVSTGCRDATHYQERRLSLEDEEMKEVCERWSSRSFMEEYTEEYAPSDRRRLATFSLDDYDDIVKKSFLMLCVGVLSLQVMSMLYAYAMPTDQDRCTLHCSRIGSVVVAMCVLFVPFNLRSVKTRCLQEYEIYQDSGLDDSDYKESHGMSPIQAVITTALIVVASFCIALFSIDVERSHTYKELEEAAHEQRKAVLDKAALRATLRATANASRLTSLQSTMNLGASFRMTAVDFSRAMNGSGKEGSNKSSFRWLTGAGGAGSPVRKRTSSFDAGPQARQFKRTMKSLVATTTGMGSSRVGPAVHSAPLEAGSEFGSDDSYYDELAEANKIKNRFAELSPKRSAQVKPIPYNRSGGSDSSPKSPGKKAFEFKHSDEIAQVPRPTKRRLTPVMKFNGDSIDSNTDALPSPDGKQLSFDPFRKDKGFSPRIATEISAESDTNLNDDPMKEPSEPPPSTTTEKIFGASKTRSLRMTT